MTAQSFGSYIKSLRTAANLSQRALAERLGVNPSFLCNVEKGKAPPFVPARWGALLAIGADVDELRALSVARQRDMLNARIQALNDSLNADTLSP